MPELPEVERFKQILLPLVATRKSQTLSLELRGDQPPRKWVSSAEVESNTGQWCVVDVLRKGKLLCCVLERPSKTGTPPMGNSENSLGPRKYFYLHMGMTGSLMSTTMSCSWGHDHVNHPTDPSGVWPPKFTYLILCSGEAKVAFADPRKFGACRFSDSLAEFNELAPDGLTETSTKLQREAIAATIANQRLGIKPLLLDQKRVLSGVGNWVCDEVLYQCKIHPDQAYLTHEQATEVVERLHTILSVAVECLSRDVPYPGHWLFGFRWTKKKAGKDCKGRPLSFLVSGGRTSAIVTSIQKLKKSQGTKNPDKQRDRKEETKSVKRASRKREAVPPPEVIPSPPQERSSRRSSKRKAPALSSGGQSRIKRGRNK